MNRYQYNKKKNKLINQILDIYEFKLNYEDLELMIIYKEIKYKSIKYLVYYYNKLVKLV
jgi:hypothetical protein